MGEPTPKPVVPAPSKPVEKPVKEKTPQPQPTPKPVVPAPSKPVNKPVKEKTPQPRATPKPVVPAPSKPVKQPVKEKCAGFPKEKCEIVNRCEWQNQNKKCRLIKETVAEVA